MGLQAVGGCVALGQRNGSSYLHPRATQPGMAFNRSSTQAKRKKLCALCVLCGEIKWSVLAALGLLLLLSLACWPKEPSLELVYLAPYKAGIKVGTELRAAPIRYVGSSESGAEVVVAGQRTFKQKGDSLDWHSSPIEDVTLDLALRVLWFDEEALHVVGKAKVTVRDPQPEATPIRTDSPMKYDAPVVYSVSRGGYIPGTRLEYLGRAEEGAKLGSIDGYPYRKLADSILWEGKLREGVFLRLNVRVLFITEGSLRVGGVATIWIAP